MPTTFLHALKHTLRSPRPREPQVPTCRAIRRCQFVEHQAWVLPGGPLPPLCAYRGLNVASAADGKDSTGVPARRGLERLVERRIVGHGTPLLEKKDRITMQIHRPIVVPFWTLAPNAKLGNERQAGLFGRHSASSPKSSFSNGVRDGHCFSRSAIQRSHSRSQAKWSGNSWPGRSQ